eukprot:895666-Rhodomonas_salina.1
MAHEASSCVGAVSDEVAGIQDAFTLVDVCAHLALVAPFARAREGARRVGAVFVGVTAHVNEPAVFVHAPLPESQLADLEVHSLASEHVTPFPSYPVLQAQVNEPSVFVHSPLTESQLEVSAVHSLTSKHVIPFPRNPVLQAQVNEPSVFVQAAAGAQVEVPAVHSLTSVHVAPFPRKPVLHAQVNEPAVFVHAAVEAQVEVPAMHSLLSVHVTPLFVLMNPALHVHVNESSVSMHVAWLASQLSFFIAHSFTTGEVTVKVHSAKPVLE